MVENILYKFILTFLLFDLHLLEYRKDLYLDLFYLTFMLHVVSKCQCLQHADDTTICIHCKIKNLKEAEQNLKTKLNNLVTWLNETNLVFNSRKTKLMVIASKQLTCPHNPDDKVINIRCEDKYLEQVSQFKLLGNAVDNNFDWGNNINKIIKEYLATIATLKEIERFIWTTY